MATPIPYVIDRERAADSVASLSTAIKVDGDTITTQGYYSPGDGGGNTYVYRATGRVSNSIVNDGGWHIFGPGSDDYFEATDKTIADALQFGCKGDGVTNDAAKIQAAADAIFKVQGVATPFPEPYHPLLYFPRCTGGYAITAPVVCKSGMSIEMDAPIIVVAAASATGTWLVIDDDAGAGVLPHTRTSTTRIFIVRQTNSDCVSEADIGVQIKASYNRNIHIDRVDGFTIGAQISGGYNTFRIGEVRNCKVAIDVVSGTNWVNASRITGGSIVWQEDAPTIEHCGIRVRTTSGGISDLICDGQSYEISGPVGQTGGYVCTIIDATLGTIRGVHFVNQREENNIPGKWMRLIGDCQLCHFEEKYRVSDVIWEDDTIEDTDGLGACNTAIMHGTWEMMRHLVFDSGLLNDAWNAYNTTADFIPGFERIVDNGAAPAVPGFVKDTWALVNTADNGLDWDTEPMGFRLDTTHSKHFMVEIERGTTRTDAINAVCVLFDSTVAVPVTAPLTTTGLLQEVSVSTADAICTTTAYGGFYSIGFGTNKERTSRMLRVASSVKSIWIGWNVPGNRSIRRIRIYSDKSSMRHFTHYSKQFGDKPLAIQAPDHGTYDAGKTIWNVAPSPGSTGWICTASGTPGTWMNLDNSNPTYATIAAVASTAKTNGDTITTQGYTAASDGGGNTYEYHSTGKSGVTVDGGFYVSLGGGDDYLEATDKSVVNIRKFGCNGTTDLAQFTLAVTTAMTLGVPVYVPPGNYDLSELTVAINLTTSLSMYGDGSQSILTGPNTTTTLFEVVNTSGAALHCTDVSFSTFFNVFNLQGNTGQPTYEVDFYGLHCNNLGAGLLGSGGGVYCLFSTVRMDNIEITNAGLDLTTAVPFAINIAVKAADAVILNSVYCDTIGSLSNTKPCIGILVDCTDSTNKLQPVVITDCVVKNVKSNTSTGTDQVVGIMMLECAGIIDSCTVDSIEAPLHTSSPEGIYCKGKKFIVNACRILNVIGSEAIINIKGGPDVPQASIGSIISNNYIGFTAQPTGNAKGIDLNLPDVHCHHNTIEDCSTGIVASMDGTLIEANVIRRAYSNTAIDIQVPYGGNPRIRVINNEFQDCGNGTDANVYACLAVVAGTETMNLLEFSGNRITGMNALTTRWGFRVTHTSSGSITHLVLNRNQMFDVQIGLNINASTNAITTCDIHDNIFTGPSSEANAIGTTATFTTLSLRGNFLDGVLLAINNDRRKEAQDTISYSATPTIDFDATTGDNKLIVLTGDVTLPTISATREGIYTLLLTQDSTGGRLFNWPSNVLGTPQVLDPKANASSAFTLYYDGINFHTNKDNELEDARLVSRWNGDSNQDGTADAGDMLSRFNLTWAGTPAYGTFLTNDYKSFVTNGTTNILSHPDAGDYADNFTIMGWVQLDAIDTRIFGKRDGGGTHYDFYVDGTGRVFLYDGSIAHGGAGANDLYAGSHWYHIAVIFNDTASKILIDGVQSGATFTYTKLTGGGDFELGGNSAFSIFMDGQLADWRIYNKALTETEILEVYREVRPLHNATLDAKVGNEVAYNFAYTVNKATSGNDTGLLLNMTDTASPGTSLLMDLQVGGVSKFKVDNTGIATVASTGYLGFDDIKLYRDDAATLALRNASGAAQSDYALRIYNNNGTWDPTTNYERGFIKWNGDALQIGNEHNGTGQARNLNLQTGGTTHFVIDTSGKFYFADTASSGLYISGSVLRSFNNAGVTLGSTNADNNDNITNLYFRAAGIATWGGDVGLNRNAANVLKVTDASTGAGNLQANVFQPLTTTVASLPAAASYTGALAYVNDATATTARSVVAGTGSNKVIVFSDGTNWLIVA